MVEERNIELGIVSPPSVPGAPPVPPSKNLEGPVQDKKDELGVSPSGSLSASNSFSSSKISDIVGDNKIDRAAKISTEFSREVIDQLNEIEALIRGRSTNYILFQQKCNSIEDCLFELGYNELISQAKKEIRAVFSKEFLKNLSMYIQGVVLSGYILEFDHVFEKIFYKLSLVVDEQLSLCQKQAKHMIYELKNILKLLEYVKKQSVPGLNFDAYFLTQIDEIQILIKTIKVDELDMKYKEVIKNLKQRIRQEAQSYKNFPFHIYGAVLNDINKLVFAPAVLNIIFALECISEIIQLDAFKKKSNSEKLEDDSLKAQLYVIDEALQELQLSLEDKKIINKFLVKISENLEQSKISSGAHLAKVFSKLAHICLENKDKKNKIRFSFNIGPPPKPSPINSLEEKSRLTELGKSTAGSSNVDPISGYHR